MPYSKWVERFKPIKNPFDGNAAVNGYLFQASRQQWDFVSKQPPEHVWTLTITDLTRSTLWAIGEGIHYVNMHGYIVTGVPADPGRHYYIKY